MRTTNAALTGEPIGRFGATFRDPVLERAYREAMVPLARRQLWMAFFILAVGNLIFIRSDRVLFGDSAQFVELIGVRGGHVLISLLLGLWIARVESPRLLRIIGMAWGLSMMVFVLYVNGTRPPEYVDHVLVDLVVLMLFYILIPLPFSHQLFLGLLFTVLDIAFVFAAKSTTSDLRVNVVWASFFLANLACAFIAARHHRTLRVQFSAWQAVHAEAEELKEALAEVRVLRGILPICAHCKKIRDDAGYWSGVEEYVSDRTDADFSHGICPDCLHEHFPGANRQTGSGDS